MKIGKKVLITALTSAVAGGAIGQTCYSYGGMTSCSNGVSAYSFGGMTSFSDGAAAYSFGGMTSFSR